jgi:hypothetical protein
MRDSIIHIPTQSSSNQIKSLVDIFIPLQLTLRSVVERRWDHICLLDVLPDGMTLDQKIVASSIFLVTEILIIEHNKVDWTFLHVAFRSQILLKPTIDQTVSGTNWRTREGD